MKEKTQHSVNHLSKGPFLILGAALLAACFLVITLAGNAFHEALDLPESVMGYDAQAFDVTIEQDGETVRLAAKTVSRGKLRLTFRAVSRGRAYFTVTGPENYGHMDSIYVHRLGIITINGYFGRTRGGFVIPLAVVLWLAAVLAALIRSFRIGVRTAFYQHRNVRNLGWIFYFSALILAQLPYLFSGGALTATLERMLNGGTSFAAAAFPFAFVLSLLVAVSNARLMKREGRNWRNMLGILMGLVFCLATVMPLLLQEILQHSPAVNMHNEKGAARFAVMAVTNAVLIAVSYIECIFLGTVALSVCAAHRIPPFDRDYILILGCQIRKDGTLTNLLKGRADRALEFARMQKEAAGKDIVFVPSGGQGADEVISEAEAVRNYLLEQGIPEDRILSEDRSRNTYENMKHSAALIGARGGGKIAFSTTNYHVFRSGIMAAQQGIEAEGIGSRTRSYFWINAFIREFIAAVYSERKKHLHVILTLIGIMLAMIAVLYVTYIL